MSKELSTRVHNVLNNWNIELPRDREHLLDLISTGELRKARNLGKVGLIELCKCLDIPIPDWVAKLPPKKAEPIKKSVVIANAIVHLKFAVSDLRLVKSKKAADYVARALKSTEGALRNAKRFEFKKGQQQ